MIGMGAAIVLTLSLIGCAETSQQPTASKGEPSASAASTATLGPAPTPSSALSAWAGLKWSEGVLGTADGSGRRTIYDILPWNDGYVGVGTLSATDASGGPEISAGFFTSVDGVHWTIVQQGAPLTNDSEAVAVELPSRLVPMRNGLLAVGSNPGIGQASPKLWRTDDGTTWNAVDSPTWRGLWTTNTLVALAGGPAGVVVVGAEGSLCCLNAQGPPIIGYSTDGMNWDRIGLSSAFKRAYFTDVAADRGGFALVGRIGEPDDWRNGGGSGVGVPAAWRSADGLTWVAAQLEGSKAAGATVSDVIVGADGLFATGRQADTSPTQVGGQGPLSGWASADGQTWQLVGQLGTQLPDGTTFAGDGGQLLMFGRESCKTTALVGWASTDGITWTRLAFSGATAIPIIAGPICQDDGTEGWVTGGMDISHTVVVTDGVLVAGSGGLPQEFWFATAATK